VLTKRLRDELRSAIKVRDRLAMTALRSAIAAIDNAGAVPVSPAAERGRVSPAAERGLAIEQSPGLGGAEAERRALTEADVIRIVQAEITDREDAARTYATAGQADRADLLLAEAAVLRRLVQA
jgi:hypothetical protein